MARLTDTQLIVLSKAAQREDGAAIFPDIMKNAAVTRVGSSLIARKLMREVRTKPGMPVWRTDEDERPMSLVILRAGRDAIGVEDDASASERDVTVSTETECSISRDATPQANSGVPRSGSKQALVIAMLSEANGATLDALIAATSWLPHTTRAVLTGLRKRGYVLERQRSDVGVTIYRIVQSPEVKQVA